MEPGHAVHDVAPAAENVFAGHVWQTLLVSAYWPAAHETGSTVQEDEPAGLLLPAAHGVQIAAPAAENVFAGQVWQTLLVSGYWPAAHVTKHVAAPTPLEVP